MDIGNLLSTVFYFLVVLSVLVLVHEIGHYIFAKRAGVRVEEFGLGYPPRALMLFKRGETIYTLNWLPLGGFVRMTGEENPSDPRSFAAQRPLVRALILVAGAGMNVLLAVVLFTLIAMIGVSKPVEIVSVHAVAPNSPAQEAGIQVGDRVLAVDGTAITNHEDLLRMTFERQGQPVTLELKRGRDNVTVNLTPRVNPPKGEGPIGIRLAFQLLREEQVSYPIWQAIPIGVQRTIDTGAAIFTGFRRMVQGTAPSSSVGGPVAIAGYANMAAQLGLTRLMEFTALLSVNLAILNLFPFPALDGGRLVFVILESLRGGKRIAPEKEGLVHFVGMAILLMLMLLITVADVQRIFTGG